MKREQPANWDEIRRRLAHSRELMQGDENRGRERQEEILRRRAALLAAGHGASEPDPAGVIDALAFELAGERYAFDMKHIATVCPMMPATPLPNVPDHVVGIVALEGEVLSVVDLRSLLNLRLARLAEPAAIIVLRSADMEFGVLAEAIVGMVRLRADTLQRDLPGLGGGDHSWLQGIAPDRTALLDGAGLLADPRLLVDMN